VSRLDHQKVALGHFRPYKWLKVKNAHTDKNNLQREDFA